MKNLIFALVLFVGIGPLDAQAQSEGSFADLVGSWESTSPVRANPAFDVPTRAYIKFKEDGSYVFGLRSRGDESVKPAPQEWLDRLGFGQGDGVMTHPFFMAGFVEVEWTMSARFELKIDESWVSPGLSFNIGMPPVRVSDGRVESTVSRFSGRLTDDGTLVLRNRRGRLAFQPSN